MQTCVCFTCVQEVSLTSAKLSKMDLLNCGELRSLSFPELDQAMGQQLIAPRASASSRRRVKVFELPMHIEQLRWQCCATGVPMPIRCKL